MLAEKDRAFGFCRALFCFRAGALWLSVSLGFLRLRVLQKGGVVSGFLRVWGFRMGSESME